MMPALVPPGAAAAPLMQSRLSTTSENGALPGTRLEPSMSTSDKLIQRLEDTGQLQECPRYKMRALQLPCGMIDACFGKERCPRCPPGAEPPKVKFYGKKGFKVLYYGD